MEKFQFYNDVKKALLESEASGRKWTLDCNSEPFRAFCSGVGGTGKSHMIDAIVVLMRELFQPEGSQLPVVLVMAPTGVAASQIGSIFH